MNSPVAPKPSDERRNGAAQAVVMTRYRCLMAGYATGDVTCWDIAWNALEAEFSPSVAKSLYGEFHHFVRVLRAGTKLTVGWRPAACRVMCRDECVILALLAAAQSGDPAEAKLAGSLVGAAHVDALVAAARSLGDAVNTHGVVAPPLPCGIDAAAWLEGAAPCLH